MAGLNIVGSVVLEWLLAAYLHQKVYYNEITRKNVFDSTQGTSVVDTNKTYEGFVLSGGSRSGKTWAIIQFIINYCSANKGKRKNILIARQQYSDLKDSVMKDFFDILNMYGIYVDANHLKSNPQKYMLYGNTINFSGLDTSGAHGKKYDVVWINEAFEAEKDAFDQLEMRLTEFFILDYNPCFTEHWILSSVITRDNVWAAPISTQLNNPWLEQRIRNKILSYDPSNPINVQQGTAEDYLWSVYGLGIGAQPQGIIYKYVDWITEFPKGVDFGYSIDFGYSTDPLALTKCAIVGKDFYIQELCYEPIETPNLISEMLRGKGVEKYRPIIADSSDKFVSTQYGAFEMVNDLRKLGWNVSKVKKTNDIVYWIGKVKEYKLHIVSTVNAKREIENYRWRTINGIQVNRPVEKWNHICDCFRYYLMGNGGKKRKLYWD
jgi:phage terminase large subunit